jgi:hypothetical protein
MCHLLRHLQASYALGYNLATDVFPHLANEVND